MAGNTFLTAVNTLVIAANNFVMAGVGEGIPIQLSLLDEPRVPEQEPRKAPVSRQPLLPRVRGPLHAPKLPHHARGPRAGHPRQWQAAPGRVPRAVGCHRGGAPGRAPKACGESVAG